jgi:hypothetical protein
VVEDARPPDAALHWAFEWDNPTAAEKYREEQARHLIRSVYVVHRAEDGTETPALGYLHVQLAEIGPAYVTTARAMSDADLRKQALEDAKAGLRSWQRRNAHLEELAPVLAAIERGLARVERGRAKRGRRDLQPAP